MSNSPKRIVIVGASLAGARAAHSVRSAGHDGPLTLIGAEPHLPYDRPPLSKEFLTGEGDADSLALDPDGAYDELDVEVMLSTHAVGLDLAARAISIAPAAGGNAETVPFDGLVIATGAAARSLPGTEGIKGVHTLRTLDDSKAIREGLDVGARVAVVGGGFIGSEVAASAVARGCEVTVIEAAPAPLMRGLGAEMGSRVGALHGDNGAELRLGVGVEGVLGTDRVEAVAMADGSRVGADLVVVGIGVVPNTSWLEGSGLQIDNGVVCDATLCCGPPGVYAVGDVARAPTAGSPPGMATRRSGSSTGRLLSSTAWRWAATSLPPTRQSPTTRFRSCGPTSTTPASRSRATLMPTTTSRCWSERRRSARCWPVTAETAA